MFQLQYYNEEMRKWWILFGSADLQEVHKYFREEGIEMLSCGVEMRIIRMVPNTNIPHSIVEYYSGVNK